MEYSKLVERLMELLKNDQSELKDFRLGTLSFGEINQKIFARAEEASRILRSAFPSKRLVGENAYKAFIVLVLHSNNPDMMEKVASTISTLVAEDADQAHRAYITDKLLIQKDQLQRYGTQSKSITADGEIECFSIEDPQNLDTRRTELGLPPWGEYKETIKKGI